MKVPKIITGKPKSSGKLATFLKQQISQDEPEEECAGRGGEEAADDIEDAEEAEEMPPEAEEARLAWVAREEAEDAEEEAEEVGVGRGRAALVMRPAWV